ncbi:MAG: hypothetical protein JRF70_15130, partial [Deltaproteobacteria bacterium]|nr:hypothetical protein [Deltaproteobacteria bacterium]
MKVYRYSRWDGSQAEFRMDAEQALDALSELLMEGLDVSEALEWMRQAGFELGGNEMRVMGVDELVRELREEARSLYERYRMDGASDELRRRFEEILDREQRALERAHGHESQRLNQFLERRHHDQAEPAGLADAIERFRDHSFEDSEAEDAYRELLEELERLRALERFQQQQGERFRGSEQADYETAQEIRERIQRLEQMAQDLADGNFSEISPEALQELLDAGAVQSLIFLRDLRSSLENAGYLREGQEELTPKAIKRLGASALAQVYDALRKGRPGTHES